MGARECECDRPSSPLSEEEARRKAFWDGRRAAERNRRRAEENENERSTEGHVSVIERHVSADAYLGASTATPEDIAAAARPRPKAPPVTRALVAVARALAIVPECARLT